MPLYPLIFEPILKHRRWGGRGLESLGKKLPPDEIIGESWELADLPETIPDARSRIANGWLRGKTLHEVIEHDPYEVMGLRPLSAYGGFPLLIKYLDARTSLSVQVHPDQAYVAKHPEAHLKSEAWYIVRAQPGAVIYKGFKPQVTREDFVAAVKTGNVVELLNAVPVVEGDCHYLPSGMCHALGAGVLAAEVQTPSDTTFRIFDWNRPGTELHIEQALECLHFGVPELPAKRKAPTLRANGFFTEELCKTEYFTIERIQAEPGATLPLAESTDPVVWVFLSGFANVVRKKTSIPSPDPTVSLSAGSTLLFPANLSSTVLFSKSEPGTFLRIALPDPMQGKIA